MEQNYQKLLDKAKGTIKEDVCIMLYNEAKLIYLEANTSGIEIEAGLLQTRDCMSCPKDKAPDNSILRLLAFARKGLTSTEKTHNNIERGTLGILHELEYS